MQVNKRGSVSHNTHSTSKNFKKYEIELDINEQPTHKKQLLTIKQTKEKDTWANAGLRGCKMYTIPVN